MSQALDRFDDIFSMIFPLRLLLAQSSTETGNSYQGIQFLWILFVIFGVLPGVICVVYYYRRLGTRRTLLLQTILSMDLADAYMQMRHGQQHPQWSELKDQNEKIKEFETRYFNEDFRADTAPRDYAVPVILFTILSFLGWFFVIHRLAPGISPVKVPETIFPDAWVFGFVGAYLACLLTLIDGFRQHDLYPSIYYSCSYRLMFNSFVAFLASLIIKDSFSPLIAFGIGSFPLQQAWNFITERTTKVLGASSSLPKEASTDLQKIQGLEYDHNRQKLIDIGIHTIQALSTADPLLIFFQTTLPLRTVIDLIDKALLYSYVQDKTVDLRRRGINGVIELVALGKMIDAVAKPDHQADKSLFGGLNPDRLIADVAKDIDQTVDEIRAFIFELYNDPLVRFINDLWNRSLPAPSPAAAAAGVVK